MAMTGSGCLSSMIAEPSNYLYNSVKFNITHLCVARRPIEPAENSGEDERSTEYFLNQIQSACYWVIN
jgi:hypothetical protein